MTTFGIIFILELLKGLEGKIPPFSLTKKVSPQGSEYDHFPLSFFIWGLYRQINPEKDNHRLDSLEILISLTT